MHTDRVDTQQALKVTFPVLIALGVLFLIQMAKSDVIPFSIPPRWRPMAAVVLGLSGTVATQVAMGRNWAQALMDGFMGGVGAVGLYELGSRMGAKPGNPPTPPQDGPKKGPEDAETPKPSTETPKGHPEPPSEAARWLSTERWGAYILVTLIAFGCSPSQQAIQAGIADGIASGANAGLPSLLSTYKAEGDAEIERAKDRPEAETGLEKVRAKWAPVWKAWETFRAAHSAWASTLEAGGDASKMFDALKAAYCDVEYVWPKELSALPAVPLTCPKGDAQ